MELNALASETHTPAGTVCVCVCVCVLLGKNNETYSVSASETHMPAGDRHTFV